MNWGSKSSSKIIKTHVSLSVVFIRLRKIAIFGRKVLQGTGSKITRITGYLTFQEPVYKFQKADIGSKSSNYKDLLLLARPKTVRSFFCSHDWKFVKPSPWNGSEIGFWNRIPVLRIGFWNRFSIFRYSSFRVPRSDKNRVPVFNFYPFLRVFIRSYRWSIDKFGHKWIVIS